jgi:MFS family permease
VRARVVAGSADCGSRRPGRRRRGHDPDRAIDHLNDVHRGVRAEQGTRGLGRTRRDRRQAAWLIGGPLVDGPGWRWIFFINIPFGLVALTLSPRFLRESRAGLARRSYDPAGAVTITGALVSLVYAAVKAPQLGWSDTQTILALGGCALLLIAFVLIESRHRAPLLPLRILRSRTLVGANAVSVLLGTVAIGVPFVLTLYAQQVLGDSARKFGVCSVVLAVGATVGAIVGQGIVLKAGFRAVAATGLALVGAGSLVLVQLSVQSGYFPDIFLGLLLSGLGIGLSFVTATTGWPTPARACSSCSTTAIKPRSSRWSCSQASA